MSLRQREHKLRKNIEQAKAGACSNTLGNNLTSYKLAIPLLSLGQLCRAVALHKWLNCLVTLYCGTTAQAQTSQPYPVLHRAVQHAAELSHITSHALLRYAAVLHCCVVLLCCTAVLYCCTAASPWTSPPCLLLSAALQQHLKR